ncbi:MAG TPA: glycosyltransferase family 39 protein [Fimbriimonadaceae bacterium]|nr:glycosyltransferase family 39 protein [Fimbriimonadaceae bacterium]HRJ95685.1 glycosyltransferase family 39 protein [Fimbriimonadaceae bacterium]
MLGLLLTLLFCAAIALVGQRAFARFFPTDADPAERFGLGGLLGLGAIGWLTFFVILLPGAIRLWQMALAVVLAAGSWAAWRGSSSSTNANPTVATANRLVPLALAAMLLVPLVNALAPSDTMDWDSLAYHFAVPKLWVEAGRMEYIPFIHHSNFPFVVENLFAWGLQWGGEQGAKGFTLAYFVFGLFTVYGLSRRLFGPSAAGWAAVALAGVPVVLWETGSGYIDVAQGLFAGLGMVYLAQSALGRSPWLLGGLLLGLAAASKYTGLQSMIAAGLVAAVVLVVQKQGAGWRGWSVAAIVAIAVASPWYVRNVVGTGNPVYPFFYERFGGVDWDTWRAEIYRNEQQTFGVGRTERGRDPTQFAAAVLGLAYQPGRFINPGQTEGRGFPMGAIGAGIVFVGLLGLARIFRIAPDAAEGPILAMIGLSVVMWFFLSQQSRYVTSLVVPLSVLAAGWLARAGPTMKWFAASALALQAGYTFLLLGHVQTQAQLEVVLGRTSHDEYLSARVGFYKPSLVLNEKVRGGKVALYDEVFGYLLDVPYVWANPGHSTRIPYDRLDGGEAFADEMAKQGFTHVYVNLQHTDRSQARRFLEAAGAVGPPIPYSEEERNALAGDLQAKWRVLVAEAAASGRLTLVQGFSDSALWELRPK